jgi:hypothetical protein
MGARPYDPDLGRFLAPDPVDGGSLNRYDYANQDPINQFDPAGTMPARGDCERRVGNVPIPSGCTDRNLCNGSWGACIKQAKADHNLSWAAALQLMKPMVLNLLLPAARTGATFMSGCVSTTFTVKEVIPFELSPWVLAATCVGGGLWTLSGQPAVRK